MQFIRIGRIGTVTWWGFSSRVNDELPRSISLHQIRHGSTLSLRKSWCFFLIKHSPVPVLAAKALHSRLDKGGQRERKRGRESAGQTDKQRDKRHREGESARERHKPRAKTRVRSKKAWYLKIHSQALRLYQVEI